MTHKLPTYQYDPDFNPHTIERDTSHWDENYLQFFKNNDQIGPHEGRYVELILSGRKALCLNAEQHIVDQLKPYIDKGELFVEPDLNFDKDNPFFAICRKDHSHYLELSKTLRTDIATCSKNGNILAEINYHKQLATILGYPKVDIDFFCKRQQARHIAKQQQKINNNLVSSDVKTSFFKTIVNKLRF